jgi:hypothetical protein
MTTEGEIKGISTHDLAEALQSRRLPADVLLNKLRELFSERGRPLSELAEEKETSVLILEDWSKGRGQMLEELIAVARSDEERFHRLVDDLMPASNVFESEVVEQARLNAEARTRFLDEFPTLSSADVAALSGSKAQNRAALANAWRKQGRVFALSLSGQLRFPLFQFTEGGAPKPQVAEVLKRLNSAGLEGWQLALWFSGASASLAGRRPVDLLDSDPERVFHAASLVDRFPW